MSPAIAWTILGLAAFFLLGLAALFVMAFQDAAPAAKPGSAEAKRGPFVTLPGHPEAIKARREEIRRQMDELYGEFRMPTPGRMDGQTHQENKMDPKFRQIVEGAVVNAVAKMGDIPISCIRDLAAHEIEVGLAAQRLEVRPVPEQADAAPTPAPEPQVWRGDASGRMWYMDLSSIQARVRSAVQTVQSAKERPVVLHSSSGCTLTVRAGALGRAVREWLDQQARPDAPRNVATHLGMHPARRAFRDKMTPDACAVADEAFGVDLASPDSADAMAFMLLKMDEARRAESVPKYGQRIEQLEQRVNQLVAAVVGEGGMWPRTPLQSQVDSFAGRVAELEKWRGNRVNTTEKALDALNGRADGMLQALKGLTARVVALEPPPKFYG